MNVTDVLTNGSEAHFLYELDALCMLYVGFLALIKPQLCKLKLLAELVLFLVKIVQPAHHAAGVSSLVITGFQAVLNKVVGDLVGCWKDDV